VDKCLVVSELAKAEKYAQMRECTAYTLMRVRFGVRQLASTCIYNPQALYFSKKFSPIFSTGAIFAVFYSYAAVAKFFRIRIVTT